MSRKRHGDGEKLTMANVRRRAIAGALLASATMLPALAQAQQASQKPAAQDGAGPLTEIIVTAQKRQERTHDVPISIAAVGAAAIRESGISRIAELQFKVPNLTLQESPIGTTMGIRGIFSGINQGFEQSVGVYVDGISYGRAQQARAPFLDLERIEVLRGPQSILFGKNSIAGALNITTAEPKDQFSGYAQTSYEPRYHDTDTTMALTGPLSDKVKFRLAGRYHQTDGFYRNATLNQREAQRDDWQLRGTLQFDATHNLTLTLRAEAGQFNRLGVENEIVGEQPANLPAANPNSTLVNGLTYARILTNTAPSGVAPVNTRIAGVNAATGMQLMPLPAADASVLNTTKDGIRSANGDSSRNKTQNYVLKADWTTRLGTVTAISGYNRFTSNELCDCDFTGSPLFAVALQETYRQFSQELRLVSPKGGAIDYIVGGFFQTSTDNYADQIQVGANSPLVPLVFNQAYAPAFQSAAQAFLAANPGNIAGAVAAGQASGNQAGAAGLVLANTQAARIAKVTADMYSAFGQATWHASKQLRVTLGARFNHETKSGDRTSTVQNLDGSAPTGLSALLTPISYASVFGISTQNLAGAAAAGVPGLSPLAAGLLAKLGTVPVSGNYSKSRFTPSLAIQYDVDPNTMLYGSWTMGAKSGGFDYRSNNRGGAATYSQAFQFGDEKAMTFETGAKLRLFNGRAEFNADVYYTSYRDLQVSIFDGILGFNVGNAAKARIYGLEAEGRLALARGLTARGSFAYTNFRFQSFDQGECYSGQTPVGPAAAQGYCSYAGLSNQFVARTSGTFALDYASDLGRNLKLHATGDIFYTGKYFASATLDPTLVQAAYAKINLRIAIAQANDRWELAVTGKNLTDLRPMTFADATPLAYSVFGARSNFAYFGEGRTFTLQARVQF